METVADVFELEFFVDNPQFSPQLAGVAEDLMYRRQLERCTSSTPGDWQRWIPT
jgi:hypothetical protein